MNELLTIGAYGHSPESFFERLKLHGVDLLVDIRQRRGMRGSTYSFLNATALQAELMRQGIGYLHLKELAPTSDIRDAQREADRIEGATKRSREGLSESFEARYIAEVMSKADPASILSRLGRHRKVCFFCVEREAIACHRSLVASWISEQTGASVVNITV
ncbi:DUF488 domain-containing protein [Lysobacter sp. HA35]